MDRSSRSRGRQACCAVLVAVETCRGQHRCQAAEQATSACKKCWAHCSADDPDSSATTSSISSATLCPCSQCCCGTAWCGTSTWQLVERQVQAWARREVSCSCIR